MHSLAIHVSACLPLRERARAWSKMAPGWFAPTVRLVADVLKLAVASKMSISNLHVKRFPQPCVQATVNPKNMKMVYCVVEELQYKATTLNQGKIAHKVLLCGYSYAYHDFCHLKANCYFFLFVGVIYENYLLGRKRALWYVCIIAFT